MAAVNPKRLSSLRTARGYFARRPHPQRLFVMALMPVVVAASLSSYLASIPGLITAVLGLGLIILIHEFGHFAAAKLCNVYVEAFAIGFGPAIVSKKVGETEYRLNLLPLGGYVKMLGQDDMDSTQMTSEEVAENPRAYSAKPVPHRMLIISAGVIMNMITAVLFYVIAFSLGVDRIEPTLGTVQPGKPGWAAGLRPGDRLTSMDARPVNHFMDIFRGTALSSGAIDIEGTSRDGTSFRKTIEPEFGGETRQIGVGPSASLKLAELKDRPSTNPGSEADTKITSQFPKGSKVSAVNGLPVQNNVELADALAENRDQAIEISIDAPDGDVAPVTLDPVAFRDFGMHLDIGEITAIQAGSVAEAEGIAVGDRLAKIEGVAIGGEFDPLRLSDYFSDRAGESINIVVIRSEAGGQPEEVSFTVTPADRRAWETPPVTAETPYTIPSLGVAVSIIPRVQAVEPGSPAEAAGIEAKDVIKVARLIPGEKILAAAPTAERQKVEIEEGASWPYVFWSLQQNPDMELQLTFKDNSEDEVKEIDLRSQPATDWWVPTARGLVFGVATYSQQAEGVGDGFSLAIEETKAKVGEIYLTLRALFTGNVGVKGLRGPVGILEIASDVAETGASQFLQFLGYISVNLAVLNFLPIPVLDGGHMVLLAYEAIFRKKPSEKFVIAVTQVGLLLLLTLFVTCTFFDFSRFFE